MFLWSLKAANRMPIVCFANNTKFIELDEHAILSLFDTIKIRALEKISLKNKIVRFSIFISVFLLAGRDYAGKKW